MKGKNKRKPKKGFFRKGYGCSFDIIKRARLYILATFLVLIFTSIVGFILPDLFGEQVLKIIEEILKQIEGKTTLELIIYIFLNNVKASLFAMVFGIFFGVFPILSGLLNGYVIGYSVRISVEEAGPFVLWRLFPHGIFEIPAIVLSMGVGFYLGSKFVETVFKVKDEVKRIAIIFSISALVVPLLFIYYTISFKFFDLNLMGISSLSGETLTLFLLLLIFDIVFLFLFLYLIYMVITNKNLLNEIRDALIFFVFIVIPLLIVAGIIEGTLIGVLG